MSIPPALLDNLNDTFLSLEKRNAILEEKLDNIEGMLLKLNNQNQGQYQLPKPIVSLMDSTQALWSALKKSPLATESFHSFLKLLVFQPTFGSMLFTTTAPAPLQHHHK